MEHPLWKTIWAVPGEVKEAQNLLPTWKMKEKKKENIRKTESKNLKMFQSQVT